MSGEEAEEDGGYVYPLPDYAAIDAFGYDVNDKTADFHEETEQQAQAQSDPDPDSVAVPDDCFGFGWLDKRVGKLHEGVDLGTKKFYSSFPRPYDRAPADVPPDHPLRAIAKVLHESPPGSNIRVKCHMLTDWFAIDVLLHYGASHVVQIIIDYATQDEILKAFKLEQENKPYRKYTVCSLRKFLNFYQRANSLLLFKTVEFRVANTVDGHCVGYSSMHETLVITDNQTTCGSYNLTGNARCKNWESLHVFATTDEVKGCFDTHWDALGEGREITQMYPVIFQDIAQPVAHKKRR